MITTMFAEAQEVLNKLGNTTIVERELVHA